MLTDWQVWDLQKTCQMLVMRCQMDVKWQSVCAFTSRKSACKENFEGNRSVRKILTDFCICVLWIFIICPYSWRDTKKNWIISLYDHWFKFMICLKVILGVSKDDTIQQVGKASRWGGSGRAWHWQPKTWTFTPPALGKTRCHPLPSTSSLTKQHQMEKTPLFPSCLDNWWLDKCSSRKCGRPKSRENSREMNCEWKLSFSCWKQMQSCMLPGHRPALLSLTWRWLQPAKYGQLFTVGWQSRWAATKAPAAGKHQSSPQLPA